MKDLENRPRKRHDIAHPSDLETDGLDRLPSQKIEEAELFRRLARIGWIGKEDDFVEEEDRRED